MLEKMQMDLPRKAINILEQKATNHKIDTIKHRGDALKVGYTGPFQCWTGRFFCGSLN